ncbi:putative F-box protein PP2-B12 [Ricinus communis]|uniref:F-box domain-containing protein n=1 Tax=Ricinus communis TaxID=3988 RepID=B9RJ45_RICCO|nr:putative F-box protein PP2-B12 [Ricinus communis]EEF48347.1 conserved hypothetical protein [Ricinus communis]|eukprot:XP_025012173.1 putative F-box protein PP2-B12 [Ricinus communis]
MEKKGTDIQELPEGCIADIFSFTTPRDACNLSTVSSKFKNASLSDTVWESFLPQDYNSIISQSSHPSLLSSCSSKKHLFLSLCQKPIIIDNGKKSFSLDKRNGKKCYMLSARDLKISWGGTPTYWRWISDPDSRFGEVAELISVCWLEISGTISTSLLSPSTMYSAYLVFKLNERAYGLHDPPVEAIVRAGDGSEINKRIIYLDADTNLRGVRQEPLLLRTRHGLFGPSDIAEESETPEHSGNDGQQSGSKERGDGWLEVELGEFFNRDGNGEELEMSVLEVKGGKWKGGLIVQGIEIRPK